MEVPTMRIVGGDDYIVINAAEFDSATMQRYEEPSAAGAEPASPPPEEPGAPPVEPAEEPNEREGRRRRGT